MIKSQYVRSKNPDTYPIYARAGTRSQGRPQSKLGNTMRRLLIGDAFFYPYTTPRSIYRLADYLLISVKVTKMFGGYRVDRVG